MISVVNYLVKLLSLLLFLFGELASESWREAWRPSPQRWIQEPSVVRDRDGRYTRGPSGSALLLCV